MSELSDNFTHRATISGAKIQQTLVSNVPHTPSEISHYNLYLKPLEVTQDTFFCMLTHYWVGHSNSPMLASTPPKRFGIILLVFITLGTLAHSLPCAGNSSTWSRMKSSQCKHGNRYDPFIISFDATLIDQLSFNSNITCLLNEKFHQSCGDPRPDITTLAHSKLEKKTWSKFSEAKSITSEDRSPCSPYCYNCGGCGHLVYTRG